MIYAWAADFKENTVVHLFIFSTELNIETKKSLFSSNPSFLYTVTGKLPAVLSYIVFPSLTWTWRLWFKGRLRITLLLQLIWCKDFSSSRATVIPGLCRCLLSLIVLFVSTHEWLGKGGCFIKFLVENCCTILVYILEDVPGHWHWEDRNMISICFMQPWTQSFLCPCTANMNFSFWMYVCYVG